MDNNRVAFIQSAMKDVQATIRAIDTKVAALLVLLLLPFAKIDRIFAHIDRLHCSQPKYLFLPLSIAFLGAWLISLISLVRAIGALDNPASHIPNSHKQKGTYYGGGIFNFCILDAFINRKSVKAHRDAAAFLKDIPQSVEDIELELVYDFMKTVYIRDLKANRLRWGMRVAGIWLLLGIYIFLASRYFINGMRAT
jgi:hypothetical protein